MAEKLNRHHSRVQNLVDWTSRGKRMGGNGVSVLVVEDHELQRRLTVKMLMELGVEAPLQGENGRQALDLLLVREQPVDLVLCDLDMPEMDGIEFISHIALNRLSKALVVVSGMDPSVLHTVETMAQAYGIQVLGSIPKPLTPGALSECLDRLQRALVNPQTSGADQPSPEDLRLGLERNEFLALYQPRVALSDASLTSVETLVRWFRPGRGILPPAEFIVAMEREGLMDGLLFSLLRQVSRSLMAWADSGLTLAASLKMSGLSLADPGIADELQKIALDQGCDPSRITLEIIETGVAGDRAASLNTLARLRLKGFGLALDDVGEESTSLDQLAGKPFTELKIDQSLLRGAGNPEWSLAVLEASLTLARKLRMRTVAERIETRADWDAAVAQGIEFGQGYFISRPMPSHQLAEWNKAWRLACAKRNERNPLGS